MGKGLAACTKPSCRPLETSRTQTAKATLKAITRTAIEFCNGLPAKRRLTNNHLLITTAPYIIFAAEATLYCLIMSAEQ